jgi:hypothetical protein
VWQSRIKALRQFKAIIDCSFTPNRLTTSLRYRKAFARAPSSNHRALFDRAAKRAALLALHPESAGRISFTSAISPKVGQNQIGVDSSVTDFRNQREITQSN